MFEPLVREAASRFNVSTASVSSVIRVLLSLIADERTGGPAGFVNLFRHKGLGDIISSWFGGKEGRTITPAQLEAVLGPSRIDRMIVTSGLPPGVTLSVLTFLVPKVIGRVTTGGTLPTAGSPAWQVVQSMDRPADAQPGIEYWPLARKDRGAAAAAAAVERFGAWSWLPWAAAATVALAGLLWWTA
jgi:uncharacterized protein YidB (DUF937 family)